MGCIICKKNKGSDYGFKNDELDATTYDDIASTVSSSTNNIV